MSWYLSPAFAMISLFVFVLGHPAYYARFGFSLEEAARFPCPYTGPHFMALRLTERSVHPAPVVYPCAYAKLD